jgi:predicted O-methyltransferase YrrM
MNEMTHATWTEVDEYFASLLLPPDAALAAALAASRAAGLPDIAVSPLQGRLLQLLAQTAGARRILEIGTLGGYSAIWLARALPTEGRLISLELVPKHAEVARANLARAGLAECSEVRVGPAVESLAALAREGAAPFDFIFIDADKTGYPDYWQWALKLARPGTLIVADNVVRRGAVVDAASTDANVQGVRSMLALIAAEPRVQATAVQTVGAKGYDGLSIARVQA